MRSVLGASPSDSGRGRRTRPARAQSRGRTIPLPGPKQRAVLAFLSLQANRVVSVGSLVDGVWGDPIPRAGRTHSPATRLGDPATASNRAAGRRLRRASSSRAVRATSSSWTRSTPTGSKPSRLRGTGRREPRAGAEALRGVRRCARLLEGSGARRHAPHVGASRLDAAAVRLDEQRMGVVEGRFDALLECGQAREALPELEHVVDEYPLRERLRGQLMLALYRCGRQADTLAAYQAARRVLVESLGIEPGSEGVAPRSRSRSSCSGRSWTRSFPTPPVPRARDQRDLSHRRTREARSGRAARRPDRCCSRRV